MHPPFLYIVSYIRIVAGKFMYKMRMSGQTTLYTSHYDPTSSLPHNSPAVDRFGPIKGAVYVR